MSDGFQYHVSLDKGVDDPKLEFEDIYAKADTAESAAAAYRSKYKGYSPHLDHIIIYNPDTHTVYFFKPHPSKQSHLLDHNYGHNGELYDVRSLRDVQKVVDEERHRSDYSISRDSSSQPSGKRKPEPRSTSSQQSGSGSRRSKPRTPKTPKRKSSERKKSSTTKSNHRHVPHNVPPKTYLVTNNLDDTKWTPVIAKKSNGAASIYAKHHKFYDTLYVYDSKKGVINEMERTVEDNPGQQDVAENKRKTHYAYRSTKKKLRNRSPPGSTNEEPLYKSSA